MTPFRARYTLRDGTRGVLYVLAASSCDAVITALDAFGLSLRSCSASPA